MNHSNEFFGMAKQKKKSTEKKSNGKGSRPNYSKTTFEFGDKVYCSNCRKHVVVNAKSQDPSTFLKNHKSQSLATSSRKSVVASKRKRFYKFIKTERPVRNRSDLMNCSQEDQQDARMARYCRRLWWFNSWTQRNQSRRSSASWSRLAIPFWASKKNPRTKWPA